MHLTFIFPFSYTINGETKRKIVFQFKVFKRRRGVALLEKYMLYLIPLPYFFCCHFHLDKVTIKCCQVRKVLFYPHCSNDCTKKQGEGLGLRWFSALDFFNGSKIKMTVKERGRNITAETS